MTSGGLGDKGRNGAVVGEVSADSAMKVTLTRRSHAIGWLLVIPPCIGQQDYLERDAWFVGQAPTSLIAITVFEG